MSSSQRIWENQGLWSPKNKEKGPERTGRRKRQKPHHAGLIGSVDFITSLCVSPSVVSDFATPWTVAHQAPLSMGFPGLEHWSGLPFPSPLCH